MISLARLRKDGIINTIISNHTYHLKYWNSIISVGKKSRRITLSIKHIKIHSIAQKNSSIITKLKKNTRY